MVLYVRWFGCVNALTATSTVVGWRTRNGEEQRHEGSHGSPRVDAVQNRLSLRKTDLDPRTSAFAAAQRAVPIHSLRSCSGHTVSHGGTSHRARTEQVRRAQCTDRMNTKRLDTFSDCPVAPGQARVEATYRSHWLAHGRRSFVDPVIRRSSERSARGTNVRESKNHVI